MGSRQELIDLTALMGYRPVPRLELGAEAAFGHESAALPYTTSTRTGFGDFTVRVRWDVVDEPMPFTPSTPLWPALSVVASVRAPTAAKGTTTIQGSNGASVPQGGAPSGTTGSVGASASSEGLGAWESGLTGILLKSLGEAWQLSALVEGAYRFPDAWTGYSRHLAPRVFGQLGGRFSPAGIVSVGALTDLGAEGDVTIEGDRIPQSSQRLWTISAYFLLRPRATRFRWGFLARTAPPVADIGRNAVRSSSVAVSIGYAVP
jgi:hypothetical protein